MIRQLLGEQIADTHVPLIRELFLQRDLHPMRMVFAAAYKIPLDYLATLVDRVSGCTCSTIASVYRQPHDPEIALFQARVEELTGSLVAIRATSLRTNRHHSLRRGSPHLSRRCPIARSSLLYNTISWYHRRFDDCAVKYTYSYRWTGN